MITFLIDEDLPRSLKSELIKRGYNAIDVRDVGLRGQSDDKIYKYAQKNRMILLTADLGFSNLIRFKLKLNCGIVIVRFPNEITTKLLNENLVKSLSGLDKNDFAGNLIIVEPGRIRLHKGTGD